MIGNDFVPKVFGKTVICSECNVAIPIGTEVLVSEKNGKVKKIVCGEECRKEFDHKFWDGVARLRKLKIDGEKLCQQK